MNTYRLGILVGDGIGPEIVRVARGILDAAAKRVGDLTIVWVPLSMGLEAIAQSGTALPDETKLALAGCHGWLLGPHDSASYPATERERRNPSGELRHHFDLYANVRPARGWPGVPAVAPQADLVVVRENTEGFYPDRNMHIGSGEWMPSPDMALSIGVFTRRAARRIAEVACQLAMQRIRGEFSPMVFTAFEATWYYERKPVEVAGELGHPPAWVYQAKYRVLKRLKREIEFLGAENFPHLPE